MKKLDPELKPSDWDEFTPEDKREYLQLSEKEQAFYMLLGLDKTDKATGKQKKKKKR